MRLFCLIFLSLSINMEFFLGTNPLVDILPTALLSIGIWRYALVGNNSLYIGDQWNKKNLVIFFLYFAFFLFSVLRANTSEMTQNEGIAGFINTLLKYIFFVIYCYLFFVSEYKVNTDLTKIITRLLVLILVTVAVDYFFWLMVYVFAHNSGGSMKETEYSLVLSLIGIQFEKKLMPLTEAHPNTMGIYGGSIVCMLIVFFLTVKKGSLDPKVKLWLRIALGIGIVFVLIVDSRGTIMNSLFLVPAIVYGATMVRQVKLLKYLVFLVPVFPFLMLFTLAALSELDFVSQLSRQEGDLASGNNRDVIWDACVNEFAEPKLPHFLGYGANGQVAAGIDKYYNYIFEVKGMIVHNMFFQTLLDMGYFGAFLFIYMLYIAMKNAQKIYQKHRSIGLPLLSFFVYYIISGTTESTHGIYNSTYNTIMLLLVIFTMITMNKINAWQSVSLDNDDRKKYFDLSKVY